MMVRGSGVVFSLGLSTNKFKQTCVFAFKQEARVLFTFSKYKIQYDTN